ncbi:MAG: class II glutamine amidotransferase, partial [Planctomycetes bacterium]|nr:class II glutamine amidotransferase [Planctomycetota bacterium]
MCGIIAYLGQRNAADVILDGLSRLEYRGYDSAGLALQEAERVNVMRAVGRLANLASKVKAAKLSAHVGIGHTRWATHGKATEVNAHPHLSADGRVALVHNGIIENYLALKKTHLRNVELYGDTDTEIAANVLSKQLRGAKTLHDALLKAKKLFDGAYAICAQSPEFPDEIAVAR